MSALFRRRLSQRRRCHIARRCLVENRLRATCYSLDVSGPVGRFVVAGLLALCVAAYVAEISGRWDRTIQDTNDEAGFVTIVLCVGVALSTTAALLHRIRALRTVSPIAFARPALRAHDTRRIALPVCVNSPPRSLRI